MNLHHVKYCFNKQFLFRDFTYLKKCSTLMKFFSFFYWSIVALQCWVRGAICIHTHTHTHTHTHIYQKEKGVTEDEMVGWHHRLNGHEFAQTLGRGGEESLVCWSVGSQRTGHDLAAEQQQCTHIADSLCSRGETTYIFQTHIQVLQSLC